jgi:hypothetical protein
MNANKKFMRVVGVRAEVNDAQLGQMWSEADHDPL